MAFRPFLKDFGEITGGLSRLQSTSEASVRGTTSGTPADGVLVKDVSVTTSAANVAHGLGRRWIGCIIVRSTAAIGLAAASSSDDTKYISVTGSGNATVDLWVF